MAYVEGTFQFLGTGGSAGIPSVGCKCKVCTSKDPKNQRLRPSGLLRIGGKLLLIDVGPDFRQQALKYGIDHLDGFLLTHTHYDHIAGIDELRIFYLRQKKAFPCLLSMESFEDLKKRYYYLFHRVGEVPTLSAQIEFHLLEEEIGQMEFLGVNFSYCSYLQGGMKVTGYRIGNFAYITDIRDFDDSVFVALKGVENLVLSALREEPSPLHLTFDEAVAFVRKVGAKKTHLTHLSHAVDHETINQKLPSDIRLGYDGLEIPFSV